MERHLCKFSVVCANSKSLLYINCLCFFKYFITYISVALKLFCILMIIFFSVNYPFQVGIYLPCYDSFRNLMENFTTGNAPMLTPYVPLVAGSAARSLACISCYPIELARTQVQVYLNSLLAMLFMSLILNCQIGCLKID